VLGLANLPSAFPRFSNTRFIAAPRTSRKLQSHRGRSAVAAFSFLGAWVGATTARRQASGVVGRGVGLRLRVFSSSSADGWDCRCATCVWPCVLDTGQFSIAGHHHLLDLGPAALPIQLWIRERWIVLVRK
jgi:hypothetical protein